MSLILDKVLELWLEEINRVIGFRIRLYDRHFYSSLKGYEEIV